MANFRGTMQDQCATIGPEEVRRIFELNASGVSQPEIHEVINEHYPDACIGDSVVRHILHRKIFTDVEIDPVTLDIVQRRFKRGGTRKKVKMNGSSSTPCRDRDTDLLHDVLDARIAYQKVLDRAVAAGMKEESVIAWCEVVAKGDLR